MIGVLNLPTEGTSPCGGTLSLSNVLVRREPLSSELPQEDSHFERNSNLPDLAKVFLRDYLA